MDPIGAAGAAGTAAAAAAATEGWEATATSLLQRHWGHANLRPAQRDAIASALAGRDALVVLAAGSGKSVCFQLVALLTGKPCLCISPLIALMQDQVQALRARGISAAVIGSAAQEHVDDTSRAMSGAWA